MIKADFQHHYSSLQCHMIFRNNFNILIYCSRNIYDYYQCWKQLFYWIIFWKQSYIYFKIEIICSILNVFNVTFDQFNSSRWIKVLISFKIKNLTWPQTLLEILWCFCKFSQMMPMYHSSVRVLLIYSFIYSGLILIWLVKYSYIA